MSETLCLSLVLVRHMLIIHRNLCQVYNPVEPKTSMRAYLVLEINQHQNLNDQTLVQKDHTILKKSKLANTIGQWIFLLGCITFVSCVHTPNLMCTARDPWAMMWITLRLSVRAQFLAQGNIWWIRLRVLLPLVSILGQNWGNYLNTPSVHCSEKPPNFNIWNVRLLCIWVIGVFLQGIPPMLKISGGWKTCLHTFE